LGIVPVAVLFGGFGAAGSLLQRRMGLPDASVLVLQGMAFVLILASEAWRGRLVALWPGSQSVLPRAAMSAPLAGAAPTEAQPGARA
jgi:simple sugar transport system permease protein